MDTCWFLILIYYLSVTVVSVVRLNILSLWASMIPVGLLYTSIDLTDIDLTYWPNPEDQLARPFIRLAKEVCELIICLCIP
jgi:hypothetical protein